MIELRTTAKTNLQDAGWRALCDRYLPIPAEDSIWRFSRNSQSFDPDQGWKLHVSATILTATIIFKRIAPYLKRKEVLFKAPNSLVELDKLNSGMDYGYSQVGKFVTVYPRSASEAVSLARQLHRLTQGLPGPAVPFDTRFHPDSCVYYRYGSFSNVETTTEEGVRLPAIRDPNGNLVPDLRYARQPKPPDWVENPFASKRSATPKADQQTKLSTFRAFQALSQRGKGGVYKAFDFNVSPPRLCVLKEGRLHGEVAWDGRDGRWLVENEERVLNSLRQAGIDVPRVYASFDVNENRYIATEFIEGTNLLEFLSKRKRRLSVRVALEFAIEIATLIARIHKAGWIWRDCKPANLILSRDGRFRPIDFEASCSIESPENLWWMTKAFVPAETTSSSAVTKEIDLYALGAVMFFLLTGRLPEEDGNTRITKFRQNLPDDLSAVVSELLSQDPNQRSSIEKVVERLRTLLRGGKVVATS